MTTTSTYVATCAECGSDFEAHRISATYCSSRCRKRAHYNRPTRLREQLIELLENGGTRAELLAIARRL